MNPPRNIFIGTDCGATTSKIAGVWGNGEAITTKLLQRPTNAQNGTDAVITGWISAIGEFLAENNLSWAQVEGVGLAIPGPYQRYGVLDHSANLPPSFKGGMFSRRTAGRSRCEPGANYRWWLETMANAAAWPRRGWHAAIPRHLS